MRLEPIMFEHVLPAYAGMIPDGTTCVKTCTCAPRIRGDDPVLSAVICKGDVCSPHTRG